MAKHVALKKPNCSFTHYGHSLRLVLFSKKIFALVFTTPNGFGHNASQPPRTTPCRFGIKSMLFYVALPFKTAQCRSFSG
jgi:hypothetical protein